MTGDPIGVAVIGAGLAGRSHANGYRGATAVFGDVLPPVRLVAIADLNPDFASDAARRFGYERTEESWEALVDADDVDAVSIVVANHLHREIAEALLAAGKSVLCEKPLAPTSEDAAAMVAAAEQAEGVAAVGFTFRRSPAINAVRHEIAERLGEVRHFNGHYWCDYGADPDAPFSWRYAGDMGSGALADVGTHTVDTAEFLCGPVAGVSGAVLSTRVADRPVPVGAAMGHGKTEVSDERREVTNDDVATFTAEFASGAVGTFSVSRVAFGLPNGLGFEVFCDRGAATFDLHRPAEFTVVDGTSPDVTSGWRQVLTGQPHPYIDHGLPMDVAGVGHGVNDFFVYQSRAFLEQVAGVEGLPPCPTFAHGLHNLRVLDAVKTSAASGGAVTEIEED